MIKYLISCYKLNLLTSISLKIQEKKYMLKSNDNTHACIYIVCYNFISKLILTYTSPR